jgi:hypothetical protein
MGGVFLGTLLLAVATGGLALPLVLVAGVGMAAGGGWATLGAIEGRKFRRHLTATLREGRDRSRRVTSSPLAGRDASWRPTIGGSGLGEPGRSLGGRGPHQVGVGEKGLDRPRQVQGPRDRARRVAGPGDGPSLS